jgi:hypothetical protein
MSSRRLATSHHTFEVKKLEICARSSTPGKSMGALIHDSSTKSWEANNKLIKRMESFIVMANGRWRNGKGFIYEGSFSTMGHGLPCIVNTPRT